MDAVCGEAIKEGTCEIQEIPSTATPLELQEVNQPYCNLLPPSLAFWPTAYTLDELSSFFRLPILFDGENIEIKKETAPKLEQTGIYLGQTNNGLSAFIDASSFKKHAFICGVPGSGKTNTMLHLANSLWHHKKLIKDDTDNLSVTFKEESDPIPFLVLEPAKREYRELSRYDIPELIILSPSASTKFPMRLNPFEFPKGLTLSEHKLDELKQQKKSLMDAGLALDSSNLDSAVQATLMESINDSLRDVENKAYDVSKDANQNLQSLEQIRQNVDDEITDSQKAKKKLDQTKKLLDTLGVGKSLEKGVNKLDDHLQEATGLKGEVISAMQDLEKVYRQLDQI